MTPCSWPFDPEDRGSTFLRNVGTDLTKYLPPPPRQKNKLSSICLQQLPSVTPVSVSQLHFAKFSGLLLLQVLDSSASSPFPTSFFFLPGDRVNNLLLQLLSWCEIHIHTVLTCYFPLLPELFVLLPFPYALLFSFFYRRFTNFTSLSFISEHEQPHDNSYKPLNYFTFPFWRFPVT